MNRQEIEEGLKKLKKLEMTKGEIEELRHLEYLQKERGLTEEQQKRLDELKRKSIALEEKWREILRYDGISPSELIELQKKYNINESVKIEDNSQDAIKEDDLSGLESNKDIEEVSEEKSELDALNDENIEETPEEKAEFERMKKRLESLDGPKKEAKEEKEVSRAADHTQKHTPEISFSSEIKPKSLNLPILPVPTPPPSYSFFADKMKDGIYKVLDTKEAYKKEGGKFEYKPTQEASYQDKLKSVHQLCEHVASTGAKEVIVGGNDKGLTEEAAKKYKELGVTAYSEDGKKIEVKASNALETAPTPRPS
jgi:hypothetical protein